MSKDDERRRSSSILKMVVFVFLMTPVVYVFGRNRDPNPVPRFDGAERLSPDARYAIQKGVDTALAVEGTWNATQPKMEGLFTQIRAWVSEHACCERGHILSKFRSCGHTKRCDKCRQHITKGQTLHGCSHCNYRVCENCMPAMPKMAPKIRETLLSAGPVGASTIRMADNVLDYVYNPIKIATKVRQGLLSSGPAGASAVQMGDTVVDYVFDPHSPIMHTAQRLSPIAQRLRHGYGKLPSDLGKKTTAAAAAYYLLKRAAREDDSLSQLDVEPTVIKTVIYKTEYKYVVPPKKSYADKTIAEVTLGDIKDRAISGLQASARYTATFHKEKVAPAVADLVRGDPERAKTIFNEQCGFYREEISRGCRDLKAFILGKRLRGSVTDVPLRGSVADPPVMGSVPEPSLSPASPGQGEEAVETEGDNSGENADSI